MLHDFLTNLCLLNAKTILYPNKAKGKNFVLKFVLVVITIRDYNSGRNGLVCTHSLIFYSKMKFYLVYYQYIHTHMYIYLEFNSFFKTFFYIGCT